MTTPTPAPDRITAQEIRDLFAGMSEELDELRDRMTNMNNFMHTIREGLQQAASQPTPITNSGQFTEMMIDNIIMTYSDKGEPAYKATGTPYNKFGVRVWPETLPTLGIDPASLKPGPNPQPAPIKASVLMQVNEEGKASPRKITGKA